MKPEAQPEITIALNMGCRFVVKTFTKPNTRYKTVEVVPVKLLEPLTNPRS